MRPLVLLLGSLLGCAVISGCGLVERLTGKTARDQARADEAKRQSEALQQKVMRYADEYVERMGRATDRLADAQGDGARVVEILEWRFTTATAAVQIAAGPNPVTNGVDMVVMVSLSRRIVETGWAQRYGNEGQAVLASYLRLEQEAWQLLETIASPQQVEELRRLLDAWFRDNEQLDTAAFIRFADFADAGVQAASRPSPGLLGIVGIDLMEGIDPAVREVEQTRRLAERAVYYAQRLPILLDIQAQLTGARAMQSSGSQRLFTAVDSVGRLSDSMTGLAQQAPAVLAREREAAIAQFMGELDRQQEDMAALAAELRAALDSGAIAADSLKAMVESVDRLLGRFERAPGTSPSTAGSRGFDINEYTRSVTELAATARELQALVAGIDGLAPRLAGQVDQLVDRTREAVDHVFWRLLLLVLAILLAAIAYRLAVRRIGPAGNTA